MPPGAPPSPSDVTASSHDAATFGHVHGKDGNEGGQKTVVIENALTSSLTKQLHVALEKARNLQDLTEQMEEELRKKNDTIDYLKDELVSLMKKRVQELEWGVDSMNGNVIGGDGEVDEPGTDGHGEGSSGKAAKPGLPRMGLFPADEYANLRRSADVNDATVSKLKSDLVHVSTRYKEDKYRNRVEVEKLRKENDEYESKLVRSEMKVKELEEQVQAQRAITKRLEDELQLTVSSFNSSFNEAVLAKPTTQNETVLSKPTTQIEI